MKKLFVFLLLVYLSLNSNSQQTLTKTLTYDGLERSYLLYVPAIYSGTKAIPLLVNIHTRGHYVEDQLIIGDFRKYADSAGFIMVLPQAEKLKGYTNWNIGDDNFDNGLDDIGFIDAVIAAVELDYTIDEKRIYVTGLSHGGFMCHHLAARSIHKIAAIAPVSGYSFFNEFWESNNKNPVPVMQFHGNIENWFSSYQSDNKYLGVVRYWAEHNNCDEIPIETSIPDIDPYDHSTVEKYIYENGDNGSQVVRFRIVDGRGFWPGNVYGNGNNDINASYEIWKFFELYNSDGLIPTSTNDHLTNIELSIYPNPTKTNIVISSDKKETNKFEIFGVDGRVLISGETFSDTHKVDISLLQVGVYFIKIEEEVYKFLKVN